MSDSNPVTTFAQELLDAINSIEEIGECGFYVYDLDDMRYEVDRYRLPAAGVIYNNFTGGPQQTRGTSSALGSITYDVLFIIGKDDEGRVHGKFPIKGPDIAAKLREILLADCNRASNGRPWEFVTEAPFQVDEATVAYLQRWRIRSSAVC